MYHSKLGPIPDSYFDGEVAPPKVPPVANAAILERARKIQAEVAKAGPDDEARDDHGRWTVGDTTVEPNAGMPTEPGYMYHATNEERAQSIADDGKLDTHKPSYGTDQSTWPDGSSEKRSYWSATSGTTAAFAPQEGKAVILRAPTSAANFKTERGTGDVYSQKPVPAHQLEILTTGGWKAVATKVKKFDPEEERDEQGKWTTGSGYTRNENKQWVSNAGPMSAEDQARMDAMVVPPAWTDVHLNPDPNGALQVRGKDAKGRDQYLYSAAHSEAAAAEKFARLQDFNQVVPGVRAAALAQMQDKSLPKGERDTAAALYLIDQTGFRIGSTADTQAEKQAYGATTLQASHVTINGAQIDFAFTGKKGVEISKTIDNRALASYLRPAVARGGSLFETSPSQVRALLKSSAGSDDFKVKDYRTWHGTALAIQTISGMPKPTTDRAYKTQRLAVGKVVAAHLGNTPSVALSAYIDPSVFKEWGK